MDSAKRHGLLAPGMMEPETVSGELGVSRDGLPPSRMSGRDALFEITVWMLSEYDSRVSCRAVGFHR